MKSTTSSARNAIFLGGQVSHGETRWVILEMVESAEILKPGVHPPADREAKRAHFRPDIEGLRAFAVVLVVLNHLDLWPAGGFVGVDVFFTISGFLITGLIADEINRTGRFSIKKFYLRRARRILPAALVALLATWIAARIVFFSDRIHSTVVDIWWCLGFAANIHFANEGTSYFQSYQQPSLVQHYWSLAVEEQFYLLWPLLLLAVTLVARRFAGPRAGRWVVGTALAGAVGSFLFCVLQTSGDPAAAYFSTPGRAWELLIGALVALAARQGLRVPARLSGPLCLVGVLGIVGSAALLNSTSTFPGPTALFPVLAGTLVLVSGCGAGSLNSVWHFPVVNPVARSIGRVSFSLYLWHWPTILVVGAVVPATAGVYYPVAFMAMATLTLFSYYAIELPFHRPAVTRRASRRRLARRAAVVGVLAVCTTLLFSLRPVPPAAVFVADAAIPTVAAAPYNSALQKEIVASLRAPTWPTLNPPLSAVLSGNTPPDGIDRCVGPVLPPASLCSYGRSTARHTALVVGDSTAQEYMEVLKNVIAKNAPDWQVRFIGMAGCMFNEVNYFSPVKWVADACPARKDAAVDMIERVHPDLVLMTSSFPASADSATDNPAARNTWAAGLQTYISHFRPAADTFVFLAPPPTDVDILKCYTALSVPANCVSKVRANWTAYAAAAEQVTVAERGHYVDSVPWFCASNRCPAFVGTVATKKDRVHLTDGYADLISPAAFETLSTAGLFQ